MSQRFFRDTFFFITLFQFATYVVTQTQPPSTESGPTLNLTSPSRPFFSVPTNSGPFGDLPTIYTFPHDIDWDKNQTEVYDQSGNVTFLLTNKVKGLGIGKAFVINSAEGVELLRVEMHEVKCLWPQTYSATHGITYKYDTRAALPDKIHILSDTKLKEGLKHKEYIFHRRAKSNTGSVQDRVAKIFQSKAEEGWQKSKIGDKKVTIIRSNDEIPGEILLGMIIISTKVIHKCNY
ncbi:hypothetical protein DFH28DRAFT_1085558 [Melampsora americana]|nr:hypothetical protein DFH28DRAFT_1085558 [Melampsora americana]